MKQRVFLRAVLVLAGLIGFSVGFGQLFFPISFEASAGIELGTDPGLLSEIRGAGGSLLLSGILMIYGAFRQAAARFALLLSTVLYLSYGVSRIYGFSVDGLPNQSFLIVTITEIVLGVTSWLLYHRNKE